MEVLVIRIDTTRPVVHELFVLLEKNDDKLRYLGSIGVIGLIQSGVILS